jgi:hypothetical protein
MKDQRRLADLVSVGKATLRDFERLGVATVADLACRDPEELYARISALDGVRHDPCVLDVFRAAVAQARSPDLPPELCRWWTWSRLRRTQGAATPPMVPILASLEIDVGQPQITEVHNIIRG